MSENQRSQKEFDAQNDSESELNNSDDKFKELSKNINREIISDKYVSKNITGRGKDKAEEYAYNVYVRLNAINIEFSRVSFQHCVFDVCYFKNCVFDSCSFVGCRFIGCNFHQSTFSGCDFDYAVFERCQIDDEILDSEAPARENLRMRFARTLRMNFQQIGDAKAVNKAISVELSAAAVYLKKSWISKETYYRKKYRGYTRFKQALKWLEFKGLDFIWGNGESILKLFRTIFLINFSIMIYDTLAFEDPTSLPCYWNSLIASPGVFLGIATPIGHSYNNIVLSLIVSARLIMISLLTAILVKRFSRR